MTQEFIDLCFRRAFEIIKKLKTQTDIIDNPTHVLLAKAYMLGCQDTITALTLERDA